MSESHYARIAAVYDTFVRTDYDVPFFITETRKANGEVLELMAGTGRLTLPLLEAGIALTCVDFSAEMLAILQRKLVDKNLSASVHHADVRSMQLGKRFSQIILPFQAFPELTSEDDQQLALARIHEHLADDGIFICTLHNPPVRRQSVDNQLRLVGQHSLSDGGQLLIWLLQRYTAGQNAVVEVLEFFEEYDSDGMLRSKRFSPLQFHLLEQAAFETLIARAGFDMVQLYGDYAYAAFNPETSPFMIYVLRRR